MMYKIYYKENKMAQDFSVYDEVVQVYKEYKEKLYKTRIEAINKMLLLKDKHAEKSGLVSIPITQ